MCRRCTRHEGFPTEGFPPASGVEGTQFIVFTGTKVQILTQLCIEGGGVEVRYGSASVPKMDRDLWMLGEGV